MPRKVEKTHAGNRWTQSRFFSFIRSNLRLMTRKWPPKYDALAAAKRPYKGPNKRRKYEYQCAACERWLPGSKVQVDHIIPCGSLRCWDDLLPFVQRMLCEADGFQVLCVECNRKKSNK